MGVLKNGWTSNDKEKFNLGEEYWCFFMDVTNKGNKLRHLNGVSLYKCTEATKTWRDFNDDGSPIYDGRTGYWTGHNEFEHISGKEIYHAYAYMNGYGSAICYFYNTEKDAKKGHDEQIKEYAKGLTVSEKNAMYDKMFGVKPNASKAEIKSMKFYDNLSKDEKGYVRWLKEYGNI